MQSLFSKNLLYLRLNRQETVAATARIFGVARVSYLHWEQGKTEPTISSILRICKFYNVSCDYLLGIESKARNALADKQNFMSAFCYTNYMKEDFGKRLKALRTERGLTIRAAAAVFHVAHTSYQRWEQGKTEPSIDTICAICDYFDVSSDYLLGRAEI